MNVSLDSIRISDSSPTLHGDFFPLYPVIQRHATVVFRHLPAVDREEAIAEAVAAGFSSFVRLKERGKDPSKFPRALATFAVLHVKNGRHVGTKLNSRDVMSESAKHRRGFDVRRLPHEEQQWHDLLADDLSTSVPDQVAFKLDWASFLNAHSPRDRHIMQLLSFGHAAKWVANKHKLSPARVTQLRKQWQKQWRAFVGDSEGILMTQPFEKSVP